MDTCSNCGATVRPGARFCTACGTRLNDVDSNSKGSLGWGESTPVEDTPAATEPPANEAEAVSTHGVVADSSTGDPATSSPPSTAWTWGSTVSDDPAGRTPASPTEDDAQPSSGAATDEQPSPAAPDSTGTFQWSWGSSSDPEAAESEATNERSTGDTMNDQPSESAEASERDDVDASRAAEVVENGETGDNDSTAEDQAGREDREAEIADMAPPYDWRQSVTYSDKEKSPAAGDSGFGVPTDANSDEGTPAVFADSDGYGSNLADANDLRSRAVELLDELRSLIPELGVASTAELATNVSEPSGGSFDAQGVIEDLESARRGVSASEDLRSVLEAAQRRPRDMDVILDLVGRAGSLIDLLDERDRLAAAIERAVSSLR